MEGSLKLDFVREEEKRAGRVEESRRGREDWDGREEIAWSHHHHHHSPTFSRISPAKR